MKLQERYNRMNLVIMAALIIIAGVIYYFTISIILTNQKDKDLVVEENEVFDYVKLNHKLPQVFKSTDQQIYFKRAGSEAVKRRFVDTTFYNSKDDDDESGRQLISSVVVNRTNYQIEISESKVETEDLIRIIFIITLGLIVLLILSLFIINKIAVKKLWRPFYNTLHQVKLFNLTDQNTIAKEHSDIEEFDELNMAVTTMALRVRTDYQELKAFLENASHELMTPIAVISSKLDTLVQIGDLNERQGELIGDVYQTMSKLTRLNRTLLLLTKIENKLINDSQTFNVKNCVKESVAEFRELINSRNLTVNTDLQDKEISINRSLFDILLNNMLSNAVRHNIDGGMIRISSNQHFIKIQNTGKAKPLNEEFIFKRFNKSSESEGSGLGLTLSKQVCENYQMSLNYFMEGALHTFQIKF